MKKLFSLSIFLMIVAFGYAQQPVIEFKVKEFDFGKIKEADGLASTVFEFTNTGVAPLVISGVSASCGCTTPEWTKEPVAAGGKGFVKATYNASGRPGPFRKSITVKSNASEASVVLIISGEVTPRPKTTEELYPAKMGDIRLKTKTTPLFDIYRGQSRTDRIEVINTSDKEVAFTFANVPKHIVLEANPSKLKPQETGSIVITYNAKNVDDYGTRVDAVYAVINGNQLLTDEYKLTINSNLREDFSTLTSAQKENAPVADFQAKSVSVEVKKGEKKQVTVDLKNSGKDNLLIRKVKIEKGVSKASVSKSTIAPNKTVQLKMDVDAANLTEDLLSKVTVITNDPKNPTSVISVNIKVAK